MTGMTLKGVARGAFVVVSYGVLRFMRGTGFAEAALLDCLARSERDHLHSCFGSFLIRCTAIIHKIDPEGDKDDNAAGVFLPPVLPKNFATMMPSSFVDIVSRFRSWLEKNFGEA